MAYDSPKAAHFKAFRIENEQIVYLDPLDPMGLRWRWAIAHRSKDKGADDLLRVGAAKICEDACSEHNIWVVTCGKENVPHIEFDWSYERKHVKE